MRGSFFRQRKLIDIVIIGRYFEIASQSEQTMMSSTEAYKYTENKSEKDA